MKDADLEVRVSKYGGGATIRARNRAGARFIYDYAHEYQIAAEIYDAREALEFLSQSGLTAEITRET